MASISNELQLPAGADFHVHLRDGALCEAVTPTIRNGGVDVVYVMPNLVPPITTTAMALAYRERLQSLAPDVTFLMTLYLHTDLTREEIIAAKKAGVAGIKAYPAGVTTHSALGVMDWSAYFHIFEEMQEQDLVLNLHGECPSDNIHINIMNAEEKFLPMLLKLHQMFPRLRIVLEHCTSEAAVKAVQQCGPQVVGTITAHHLFLTLDDWAGDSMNWCKPAAKLPQDRRALLQAASSNNPKFFFGSDSAPHPVAAKRGGLDGKGKQAAGVFTSPYAIPLVVEAFEQAVDKGDLQPADVTVEHIANFISAHGRRFYGVPDSSEYIIISDGDRSEITDLKGSDGSVQVVPFRIGQSVRSVRWSK